MTAWILTGFSLGTKGNCFTKNYFALLCDQPFSRAAEHRHWMAWTIFARARSAPPIPAFSFHNIWTTSTNSINPALKVEESCWQKKPWEMTDVFPHAEYSAETHLYTRKIKTDLVLTSPGVSLNPLSTAELSCYRRLCSKSQGCFPVDSCVHAGGMCIPDCQGRYPPHVGVPARMLGPEQTGTCHISHRAKSL